MEKKIVLIGAGGHGKVIADIAIKNGYEIIGFLDDNPDVKEVMGFPVIGKVENAVDYIDQAEIFVSIGGTTIRRKVMTALMEQGAKLAVLIHPNAVVGMNVEIGEGTAVMAGAVINPNTKIGKGCIINTSASVDHDCVIEDYVHVSVGVHVAGTVRVSENTWIGIGATLSDGLSVCGDCMIGAGAVVVKDIKEKGTYVGVPARRIK